MKARRDRGLATACVAVLLCASIAWRGLSVAHAQGAGEEDGADSVAGLKKRAAELVAERADVVARLRAKALDGKGVGYERREAFDVIGELGGAEAARVLAEHRDLLVPTVVDGDTDMEWQVPAREALVRMRLCGVPALLNEMSSSKRDDKAIRRDAEMLERMCGREVAIAVVGSHRSTTPEWAANRPRLLKALEP